ncbi:hypothetical protein Q3G72_000272 [Acer saccharum]|nr:hypothetical protein Q3G72_000272 [Acer saccharum]
MSSRIGSCEHHLAAEPVVLVQNSSPTIDEPVDFEVCTPLLDASSIVFNQEDTDDDDDDDDDDDQEKGEAQKKERSLAQMSRAVSSLTQLLIEMI